MTTRLPLAIALMSALSLLGACREDPKEHPVERTVLLAAVTDAAASSTTVMAEVRHAQRARLSFDSAGRLASVGVKPGDAFVQGQVLARLDPEPARLRLAQADADVDAARADALDRAEQLRQQVALFADGASSQTALSLARAADRAARGKVDAAQAAARLATREVTHTTLVAPFAGRVVTRQEEPSNDVAAAQTILTVDGQGDLEIVSAIPATQAATLHEGSLATVNADDGTAVPVQLTQLSDHRGKGATVDAIFRAPADATSLVAGQLVELKVAGAVPTGRLSLPLTAVVPGASANGDSVFVFDATHGAVNRRPIVVDGHAGDRVLVAKGLAAGDLVVTAGAAFLVDGQRVREFEGGSRLEAH